MKSSKQSLYKLLSAAGLLFATVIWGGGFIFTKTSLDAIPPIYLMAFRFTVAAVGLLLIFFKKLRGITRRELLSGSILGVLLFLGYLTQTYGVKYTTVSKNAFITTLYVVFIPFLGWALNKKRPAGICLFAAALATAGIGLLTLDGSFDLNIGDLLTLLCALVFALHIHYIDRFTEKHDPIVLTVLQITVAALLSWVIAPFAEGRIPAAVLRGDLLFSMLYLGLASTMLCFLLQNVGQKHLSTSTSSLLLSFESVFGCLFSVIFLNEDMTPKLLIGCICIFAAVILSEIDIRAVLRKIRGIPKIDTLPQPAEAAETGE